MLASSTGSDENQILPQINRIKQQVLTNVTTTTSTSLSQEAQCKVTSILSAQSALLTSNRGPLGDIGNRLLVATSQTSSQTITTKKETSVVVAANNEVEMAEDVKLDDADEDEDLMEQDISDITDIDEFDSDNPQMVSEYIKDIYVYLNETERKFRISPQFLEGKIVTAKMRSVLIDWLIQVHLKFHLLQETLYLCVQIIDSYLQRQDVPKLKLQLVGVTAMFVASKYEEMYVPAIEDFVYMTDNTYTKGEIRHMEIDILKTMEFLFSKPLPLHFLRRFSKAGRADPKQHTLAKYFMELTLHDAEFSSVDPSFLAACSLCLSFKLLNGSEWSRCLEFYSTYKQNSMWSIMQKIAKLVLKTTDSEYKYKAATNKYGSSKTLRISILPELTGQTMRELANNGRY